MDVCTIDIEYSSYTDEELVQLSQSGDKEAEEYLILKYMPLVHMKSGPYFLKGGDDDDLNQEGMIGLFKAIRDYDSAQKAGFKTFANLCVSRQIITAIKKHTRQKHIPLNTSVSLNSPVFNDELIHCKDFIDSIESMKTKDPIELIILNEKIVKLNEYIYKNLSKLERAVLQLYIYGMSYDDIAVKLNKNRKSIDNALNRAKNKLINYTYTRE